MEIVRVDADDSTTTGRLVSLEEAALRVDAPWAHPPTERTLRAMLRHGWDGEPPEQFVARLGGQTVGSARVWTSDYDNLEAAWLDVVIHPEHRRVGHGSALLDVVSHHAIERGRTSLTTQGWDSVAARTLAEAAGFRSGLVEVFRRLDLADVPDGFGQHVAALRSEHAGDYEFCALSGPLPEGMREPASRMWAAINDAPWGDIEMEPEVFPVERILDYERAQAAAGRRLHRVIARHLPSGELAGHSVVAVEAERPHFAEQHDTSVLVTHRGHRLGIVLKALLLDHLRRVEPQVRSWDTSNAASNAHMIAVNDAMGYREISRGLVFQRRVTG